MECGNRRDYVWVRLDPPIGAGEAANEHELGNVGFQLDLNFTVALYLPMTFSVGYAHGFGDNALHGREEILASLKIL